MLGNLVMAGESVVNLVVVVDGCSVLVSPVPTNLGGPVVAASVVGGPVPGDSLVRGSDVCGSVNVVVVGLDG